MDCLRVVFLHGCCPKHGFELVCFVSSLVLPVCLRLEFAWLALTKGKQSNIYHWTAGAVDRRTAWEITTDPLSSRPQPVWQDEGGGQGLMLNSCHALRKCA